MMHNWSPFVTRGFSGAGLVLADTTQFLTAVTIDSSGSPATVTAQSGGNDGRTPAGWKSAGLGLTAHPAPGDITIGGALAIDGHGTAVPAEGETIIPGHTYGSLSNLILSLTAVVWRRPAPVRASNFRAFGPGNPASVNPSRENLCDRGDSSGWRQHPATVPELRNVPASALFGAPGSSSQTFDSYVQKSGRVETIWFPLTSAPWLKVWTIAPQQPLFT